MKRHVVVGVLVIATGLLIVVSEQGSTTPPRLPMFFEYWLTPESFPEDSGPIQMSFTVRRKPGFDCDTISGTITLVGPISYTGPMEWQMDFTDNEFCTVDLSFTVPDDTLCGFEIKLQCGRMIREVVRYFRTTGDTLEYLYNMPLTYPQAPNWGNQVPPGPDSADSSTESTGHMDSQTKTSTPQPIVLDKAASDSIRYMLTLPPRERTRWMLERHPLTYKDRQHITVNDTAYVRYRGETKFHLPQKEDSFLKEKTDSLEKVLETKEFFVLVTCRKPEELATLRQLVDSFAATDVEGVYEAHIKYDVIQKLAAAGIKVRWAPREAHSQDSSSRPDSESKTDHDQPEFQPPGEGERLTLFSDDFECCVGS